MHQSSDRSRHWKNIHTSSDALRSNRKQPNFQLVPSISTLVAALKLCSRCRDPASGIKLHADAVELGMESNSLVSNALLEMYSRCGRVPEARRLFESIPSPSSATWNSIILVYAGNNLPGEALEMLFRLLVEGFKPDSITLMSVFKALAKLGGDKKKLGPELKSRMLSRARLLHSQAADAGFLSNPFVANTLVLMFSKFGCMPEARRVFDRMPDHSLVSWNILITGYSSQASEQGNISALEAFNKMQELGFEPNEVTYTAVFKSLGCSAVKQQARGEFLAKGRILHRHLNSAIKPDDQLDLILASTLVDFYTKCGSLVEARQVFDRMQTRDLISWSTLVMGYAENEQGKEALELFGRLVEQGFAPDAQAFLGALKGCGSLGAKSDGEWERRLCEEKARDLHARVLRSGLEQDSLLAAALVEMFVKCGCMPEAREVFQRRKTGRIAVWNSMIQASEASEALEIFQRMEDEAGGLLPDGRTYAALFKSCARSGDGNLLGKLSELYHRAEKQGLCSDVHVGNSALEMFLRCGSFSEAEKVFRSMQSRSTISWNTMISGCVEAGEHERALDLFEEMKNAGDSRLDSWTYVVALEACAASAAVVVDDDRSERIKLLEKGRVLLRDFENSGNPMTTAFRNSAVRMFAKCGSMLDAKQLLDKSFKHGESVDSLLWKSMITGYAENGEQELALETLENMKQSGVVPDSCACVAGLKACTGTLAGDERGRALHGEACRRGFESNSMAATSLMNFYGECGRMDIAELVFDHVHVRDVVAWNSLLSGYAREGNTIRSFELLRQMKDQGVEPSRVTFLSVLSLCSHSGLVEQGKKVFGMIPDPGVEHYSCVIDLLGRAKRVEEAAGVLKQMPVKGNARLWMTMLDKCGGGKLAYDSLSKINVGLQSAAPYLLMSNNMKTGHKL